jgi:DNA mismatch endonuclease (patch repair protein)
MRANRRTDTKPEMALRRALHGRGLRYRKDYRLDLDGARVRPDIAFTARRVAVFVDGCFWHVCPEHGTKPANNTWYWGPKLTRNVERDRAADAALAAAGWRVVRVWEHEPLEAAVAAVVAALQAAGYSERATRPDGPEARLPHSELRHSELADSGLADSVSAEPELDRAASATPRGTDARLPAFDPSGPGPAAALRGD